MADKPVEEKTAKVGYWVYTEAKGGMYYWYCSACEQAYHKSDPRNKLYCYHCGSRMILDEKYK